LGRKDRVFVGLDLITLLLQRYIVENKAIIEDRLLLEIKQDITTIENSF